MEKIRRYPIALTIAGSDSGACAEIQAYLKTFSSLGVFVASTIAAQSTTEVRAIEVLSTKIIKKQPEAVLDDITVDVIKTGILPSIQIIELISSIIDRYNLPTVIVDPVMVTTSEARLTSTSIVSAFCNYLYPRITLITPNLPEAKSLSGIKIHSEKDIYAATEILLTQECPEVLIEVGHSKSPDSTDILFTVNSEPVRFSSARISPCKLHSKECTYYSSIVIYISLDYNIEDAIRLARNYISSAINKGKGCGPVNHSFKPQTLKIEKYDD